MKAYTDLEQSKRLAEILPLESADMWYWEFPTAPTYNGYGYPMFHKGEDIRNIPCWSLAALLSVYPMVVGRDLDMFCCWQNSEGLHSRHYDNPVDACVEMILKLHERNLL